MCFCVTLKGTINMTNLGKNKGVNINLHLRKKIEEYIKKSLNIVKEKA